VKHFCKVRNAIPYIQDTEIINTFRDGVSDIKTMEEIAMKKPKMVADLLTIADACIEASEPWAGLFESHGKGASKKKQDDQEVNMTNRRDCKDRGDHRYRASSPLTRKKRCPSVALMM
jgi:hypothetical protein